MVSLECADRSAHAKSPRFTKRRHLPRFHPDAPARAVPHPMKKKLLIIAGVLVVLLVVGFVVVAMSLGKIIKTGVETVGPTLTKTEMKLDSATLSLLGGAGTLKGFNMGNPEGFKTPSSVKAGSVSLGVKPGSLFSDKVHVTHVRVEGPEITFEGTIGTKNNLSQILANVEAATGSTAKPAPTEKGSGASRKLQVDEFSITGAKVNLSMTLLGGRSVTVPLPPIKLENLGQGADGITVAELTKKVLSSVTVETLKAAEKAAVEFGKNATEAVTKTATEALDKGVDKAAKGLEGLFKKKDQ